MLDIVVWLLIAAVVVLAVKLSSLKERVKVLELHQDRLIGVLEQQAAINRGLFERSERKFTDE